MTSAAPNKTDYLLPGGLLFLLLLAGCGMSDLKNNGTSGIGQRSLLPEQYIWLGAPSLDSSSPRFFRKSFVLAVVPEQATLYVVGPYNTDIFINGVNISHLALGGPVLVHDRPVVIENLTSNLRAGKNVFGVKASASDIIAAKIVPAEQGVDLSALVISDSTWRASETAPAGWEQPDFDDTTWVTAQTLGSIESDPRHFRGNFDFGMYQWPGYEGLSAVLQHASLKPASVTPDSAGSLLIDFGKEITGRLEVVSRSQKPLNLLLSLGESEQEATPEATFFSARSLVVPALATAFGPLTAFRFIRVTFLDGPETEASVTLVGDQVLPRMVQRGSFSSSDASLNLIWQRSVYTAQLGMQETFWDAPKRDRNPFSGDLFVAGRTSQVAFGNQQIVPATLTDLLSRACNVLAAPVFCPDINGIPGYNAWWVLDLADWYRFSGDISYLRTNRDNLVALLNIMLSETTQNLFDANKTSDAVFADWSPGMIQFGSVKAPEAIKITTFVYYMAFKEGAALLAQLGDTTASDWEQRAAAVKTAAISAYWGGTAFGPRMQTNAMAVFSGIADTSMAASIFTHVLSQPATEPVTPYFSYFVLSAMAQTGNRKEALGLIRQQWGSMLQSGATTFWEVYDPACTTSVNFHACLTNYLNSLDDQGTNRLFVSLAHAWSSGPAPWLHQEILGIKPLRPGFTTVLIRPDLAGLQWARGTQPVPNGIISINIGAAGTRADLDIPSGMEADVSMPTALGNSELIVNGTRIRGNLTENGTRVLIHVPDGHSIVQSF